MVNGYKRCECTQLLLHYSKDIAAHLQHGSAVAARMSLLELNGTKYRKHTIRQIGIGLAISAEPTIGK